MAWPRRVDKNSPLHWAGRISITVAFVLFMWWAMYGFLWAEPWSNSKLGLLADAMIIAIAVWGVNLITGYTGQLSIGHAAFFAIGAYVGMMLTEGKIATPFLDDNRWTAGWTFYAAAIVCFVVGCVVGLPALRLKGIYLALVTLVFVEATRAFLGYGEFAGVTGGATGIKGSKYSPPEWASVLGVDGRRDINKWFVWLCLIVLGIILFSIGGLLRSRIGRAMIATRDNETAAAVMGVNLAAIKTIVFGLSGAITGVGGALFGHKLGLVEPAVPLFGLFGAITFLVAMVVGGAAQTWGPFVGAFFYVFVNDIARSVGEDPDGSAILGVFFDEGASIDGLGGIVFGVLLIVFARFAPMGAVGTLRLARARAVVVVPKPPDGADAASAALAAEAEAGLERAAAARADGPQDSSDSTPTGVERTDLDDALDEVLDPSGRPDS